MKLHCYKGSTDTSPRTRCGASVQLQNGRVVTLQAFSGNWPRHLDRCRKCLRFVRLEELRKRAAARA